MKIPNDPRELAIALMSRSGCAVQVSAVLADAWGIHAWGWNSMGAGYGMHAEEHCLSRTNQRRLPGSTLYVAAQRRRNSKIVIARPCAECQQLIRRAGRVIYRDGEGKWVQDFR